MATAQTVIVTSAIVVGGVWGYRKLVEPHASAPATGSLASLAGVEPAPASTAQFLPAYAFTFLSLSVIAVGAPELAKGFAALIAVADLLTNGLTVFSDIGAQTAGPTPAQQKKAKQGVVVLTSAGHVKSDTGDILGGGGYPTRAPAAATP